MAWAQDFKVTRQLQLLQVLHDKVAALAAFTTFVVQLFQLAVPPVLAASERIGHAATLTTGLAHVRVEQEVLATMKLTITFCTVEVLAAKDLFAGLQATPRQTCLKFTNRL